MKRNDKPTWLMLLRDIAEVAVSVALFGLLLWAFLWVLVNGFKEIGDALKLRADTVSEDCGVGRATASLNGVLLLGGETDEPEGNTVLRVYTEGVDSPLPEWFDPGEEMAVEWYDEDHFPDATQMVEAEPHPPVGVDPGGIDYNLCTTLWGWDGHSMEAWEMDLFSMIFYREFWQPNLTLCEAGCDAILQLWDLNGRTMFETLSHVNEDGSYAFSTYPGVWETEYDLDGLAWCRAYCEKRFYEGPSWPAQYFRKGQYHDWDEWSPIPAYEIDGIYFSIGR
jgi:hypothetical protein